MYDAPYHVLFEDNHLLIVNKAPGVLVQADESGDEPLEEMLKTYIKHKYQKPGAVFLEAVHRLDRPVSGVVAFGRTSKGVERMTELFRERLIEKVYWAMVAERPPADEDHLIHWLVKDTERNVTKAHLKEVKGGLKAELRYKLIGMSGTHFLLEVSPLTGRPHQIRAQLAKIGCPIQGDLKYGSFEKNSQHEIGLHSRRLSFMHPVRKEWLSVSAPVPRLSSWQRFWDFKGE